jgi:hypothetical protein
MGYTTEFSGSFKIDRVLDADTAKLVRGLSKTRRMARRLPEAYGVEGEFYVDGGGRFGRDRDESIINFNQPPSTQPSLWCCWTVGEDLKSILWNESEKFYEYVAWLKYLQTKILIPRGYSLSGEVSFQGEDPNDFGVIRVDASTQDILVAEGRRVLGEFEQA